MEAPVFQAEPQPLVLRPASRREGLCWAIWSEGYSLRQAWRGEPLWLSAEAEVACTHLQGGGYVLRYRWHADNELILATLPEGWPLSARAATTTAFGALAAPAARAYLREPHRRSVSATYWVLAAPLFFWALPRLRAAWMARPALSRPGCDLRCSQHELELLYGGVVAAAALLLPLAWAWVFQRINGSRPQRTFERRLLRWEAAVFAIVMAAVALQSARRISWGEVARVASARIATGGAVRAPAVSLPH